MIVDWNMSHLWDIWQPLMVMRVRWYDCMRIMAQWYNGTKAHWYDVMVRCSLVKCDGTMVHSSMRRWLDGTMSRWQVWWYDGMMAQWYNAMVRWQVDGLYYVDFCCEHRMHLHFRLILCLTNIFRVINKGDLEKHCTWQNCFLFYQANSRN